jgi:hypothetical protein
MSGLRLSAATLQTETVSAWDSYVHTISVQASKRGSQEKTFLRLKERSDLVERIRSGEIVAEPAIPSTPKAVPSGLIHDWLGAAYVPHTTIDQMLPIVRDYARYKDFYQPAVLDSKPIALNATDDRFSIVLANKSFFRKRALDSECKVSQFRVGERRWYSFSETTRVREVAEYGSKDQHLLPEDEGTGLIWRLFTVMRLEEQDGGVFVEVEAIALSRDIPGSMRWVVDPIVRRMARASLITSLTQTRDAVEGSMKGGGMESIVSSR